jgi:hypothetical protein
MFDGIVSLLKHIPRPKEWVPEKASVCGRKAGRSAAVLASPACRQESDSTAELSAQQRDGHSEWRNHVRAQRDACREERRRMKRDKDDYREVRQCKRG